MGNKPNMKWKKIKFFGSKIILNQKRTLYRADKTAYMDQHTLFACKLFSIRLHTFLASDDTCPHNHPWAFISFIRKGSYVEHTYKELNGIFTIIRSATARAGQLLFRPHNHIHRIEIDKPCKTLVITFRLKYDWGFFNKKGEYISHDSFNYSKHCN